jgi:hypothetical protein
MTSLVLELQKEALESTASTLRLLRKALAVSKKLNLQEFEKWVELELNGYNSDDDIPEYRSVYGQLRGWNPYHGWQPIIANCQEMVEFFEDLCNPLIQQPISELTSLIQNPKASLQILLSPQHEAIFANLYGAKVRVSISSSAIRKILEAVQDIILKWSLQLEADGILGEGMSFSPEEKSIASKQSYINLIYQTFNAPVGATQAGNDNLANVTRNH